MDEPLRRRIAELAGRELVAWAKVERGYTPAERWRVGFAGGASAFAKVGATPLTAAWLRDEHRWYSRLRGDFLPRLLGFADDAERPLLLLEDLSHARWPPPWGPGEIERLVATLARVAAARPLPSELEPLEARRPVLSNWNEIATDPGPFLSLGLCSPGWLEGALPALIAAQDAAPLAGDDLVHFDVRSDNVCLLPDRVVLVDWNLPARGNRAFDLACLAPSLRLEGGPLPEATLPDAGPLAAMIAGHFAAHAGQPPVPGAPRVRWIQLRQLRVALPWAARSLGLPAPDLPWARREGERLDAVLAAGAIDEAAWYERNEEARADAYLASDDPRAQSGNGGDEVDWRWSRELILDALPAGGSLLDVGCANGYLMESAHRWGAERGVAVEPHGLDLSWRLAALARRRLPHWADRVWVGNVIDWAPPRRFDLVHLGLDYAPAARRRELVERALVRLVAPGGRLVFRAERVTPGGPDVVADVRALGFVVGGVAERAHPRTGVLRRTAWVDAPSS